MPIEKMKPIHTYIPITRVNEEKREIEAYGFTQEVVEGEGGKRLKRSSMEEATPDYMTWANIRRMHQPDAVGVAKSVNWDNTGAKMTIEIVDDDAWEKVKRGVYKGLSVGVNALVMRGLDVEKCRWFETSLVDRPKDPGAKILAFRAEDAAEEVDCEVLEERAEEDSELERINSSEAPSRENLEGKPKKMTIYDCGVEWHRHSTEGGAAECQDNQQKELDERISWLQQSLSSLKAKKRAEEGGEIERAEDDPPAEESLTRIAALETEAALLLTRAETAESELAIERAALAVAKERVKELERSPRTQIRPVLFPQAAGMERTFAANEVDPITRARQDIVEEIQRLGEITPESEPDPEKRQKAVERMIRLSNELKTL